MNSELFKNVYGQIKNFWSTVGLAIVLALAEYLIDNQTWTWKAALVAGLGAFVKYFVTRDDHKKTVEVVKEKEAEIETITKGELK